MNGIELIRDSGLVDESALEAFKADFFDVRRTVQVMRTPTEMVLSVLNDGKHPNADAKYWQATREVDVQYNELVTLSFGYRKQVVALKKLERDLESEQNDLEVERLLVEIDEARYTLSQQERICSHRLREIAEWTSIRAQLVPQLEYGTEDVNAHQMVSLPQRFRNQASALTGSEGVADRINIIGLLKTAERVQSEVVKGALT